LKTPFSLQDKQLNGLNVSKNGISVIIYCHVVLLTCMASVKKDKSMWANDVSDSLTFLLFLQNTFFCVRQK